MDKAVKLHPKGPNSPVSQNLAFDFKLLAVKLAKSSFIDNIFTA